MLEKYQKSKEKLDDMKGKYSVVKEISKQKNDTSILEEYEKDILKQEEKYWTELLKFREIQADNSDNISGKKFVLKHDTPGIKNSMTTRKIESFEVPKTKTVLRPLMKENKFGELIQVKNESGKQLYKSVTVTKKKSFDVNYNVKVSMADRVSLESDNFKIGGVAISSELTDNGHRFDASELRVSADSLVGRPLLSDHNSSVNSIVGKVTMAKFDESKSAIVFEATVNKSEAGLKVRQLILDGDLSTVSVGANVQELIEEDGIMKPTGIKFKELSLVATPADDNAKFRKMSSFELALRESYYK